MTIVAADSDTIFWMAEPLGSEMSIAQTLESTLVAIVPGGDILTPLALWTPEAGTGLPSDGVFIPGGKDPVLADITSRLTITPLSSDDVPGLVTATTATRGTVRRR